MNGLGQHGKFTLEWQGDVLIAHYGGAWNEVAVVNLHRQACALWTARASGRRWGMLSDLREWDGATPEAMERWWEFFADAAAHGLSAVTDVMPSHFHEVLVRSLAERASRLVTYKTSVNLESGLAWLAAQGLAIGETPPP